VVKHKIYHTKKLQLVAIAVLSFSNFQINVFSNCITIFGDMVDEKTVVAHPVSVEQSVIGSYFLDRDVMIDAYLPENIDRPGELELLLINDGQDLPKMPFNGILDNLINTGQIKPLVCIGIYCGPDRKMEYGTAGEPNYEGWGAKAGLYTQFVFEELLPFIRQKYNVPSFKEKSFAGFSLGALSALDIVWNNPQQFSKAGAFSGSFWWRSKGYGADYNDDTDRIMHERIKSGGFHPWLKFFFECGRQDETADRNNNGIIDSIDDTLGLIELLVKAGYTSEQIDYLELANGRHDVPTWAKAFPEFLRWGWGKAVPVNGSLGQ
jgi:enterochelin esterase-like enzyme